MTELGQNVMRNEDMVTPRSPGLPATTDLLLEISKVVASHVSPHFKDAQSCNVVRARRKMGCLVIELEVVREHNSTGKTLQYICRDYETHKREQAQTNFDALSQLWSAGFRPPSPYTVVQPVAFMVDHVLLVQEKAPGHVLADVMFEKSDSTDAVARAAGWLAALHAVEVNARPRIERVRQAVARYGCELAESLPCCRQRIRDLTDLSVSRLEDAQVGPLVPSHGDFHPANVFIAADGRVTAIDLVNFGLQERAADVAYFLAQTAIFGFFRLGSFAATARSRDHFLKAYEAAAQPANHERLGLYLGTTFLQSLHYELCVLRTANTAIIEPWLLNSEHCLRSGDIRLHDVRQAVVEHCGA